MGAKNQSYCESARITTAQMNDRRNIISSRRQHLVPHDDAKIVLVEFYSGAYGPTLRADVKHADRLAMLRTLFRKFANNEVQRASISEIGQVRLFGLEDIAMALWPNRKEPRKFVKRVQGGESLPAFRWTRNSDGWKEWAEMLDALKGPGHQYLAGRDQDDALLEISFMEFPDLPDPSEVLQ